MICEICGKKTDKIIKIFVEGAVLNVCPECAKYGKIIYEEKKERPKIRKKKEDFYEDIVEDYNVRIKEAREKLGLSIKEFCKKYSLDENIMRKIERGILVPDLKLAKKLEKILKIKLIENRRYVFDLEEKKEEEKIRFADIVELK